MVSISMISLMISSLRDSVPLAMVANLGLSRMPFGQHFCRRDWMQRGLVMLVSGLIWLAMLGSWLVIDWCAMSESESDCDCASFAQNSTFSACGT